MLKRYAMVRHPWQKLTKLNLKFSLMLKWNHSIKIRRNLFLSRAILFLSTNRLPLVAL